MRNYTADNWKRLGRWVHDARLSAGWVDMKAWALAVERSTRQLQGLERGEPVGEKTLENVARVLNRELGALIGILAEDDDPPESVVPAEETKSVPAWNTRRPEGMTDERYAAIVRETEEFHQFLIDKASKER